MVNARTVESARIYHYSEIRAKEDSMKKKQEKWKQVVEHMKDGIGTVGSTRSPRKGKNRPEVAL